MVSSVLSPEKVIGRQNTNKAAAQNFISGDSVLGSSVAKSAANKIVGFQRAGVQPAAPNVNNVVNTISTNINNNVTSTINKTIQGFSADYQKRIKQVDDAKPLGILGKFLNVYKTALGFINFFGNKRNIDRVRDNLDALKKSFIESFEVAKLIRQVIIKIVKQLSNLPVASPSGGGGLNLDVDIPGGPLRKTAPRNVNRMRGGGGRMLALGAGALGLGALGAGTVNALSDSPQDQAQAAQTTPDIPGDVVDKFSSIVDRFANVISKLFNMKNEKSKGSSGSGGGGKTSGGPPGGGPPGGGKMGSPVDYSNLKSGDISTMAGKSAVLYDEYRNLGYTDEGAKRLIAEIGREGGMDNKNLFGTHTDPSAKISNTGMFSWNQDRRTALIDQAKKAGVWDETKGQIKETAEGLRFQARFSANEIKTRGAGVPEALTTQGYSGAKISQLLRDKYVVYRTDRGYSGGPDSEYGSVKTGEWYKKLTPGLEKTYKPKTGVGGPDLPDYMLPPEKRNQYKNLATDVSQPPPSQQQQQPVIMPINLGGGGQQQSGGGSSGGGGGSQGSGPSVPFLPAGNSDNFLVLYSRMVYNIVDG
jgi:hypothetical protein